MGHANVGRELVAVSRCLLWSTRRWRSCHLEEKSVFENFTATLLAYHSLKENEEACRAALIHEFVRDLPQGYDTLIGGGAGIGLSSGQLQRLSIARARLLRNPTALVLGMFPLCHFYP